MVRKKSTPKRTKATSKKTYATHSVHIHKRFLSLWKNPTFLSFFLGFTFMLILVALYAPLSWMQFSIHHPQSTVHTTAIYKGNLPCADCTNIEETITFSSNNTYTEQNRYIGKDTMTNDTGVWKHIQGTPKDPQAILYQLTPTGQTNAQFYLLSQNKLIPLDEQRKEIVSPFDLSLTKQ